MRHIGEEPDEFTSEYLAAVMNTIREKVAVAGAR